MMITLHSFQTLSVDAKVTALWEIGSFIWQKINGGERIILYKLSDFYVKVRYRTDLQAVGDIFCYNEREEVLEA
ncbi:MAG: hypothetical protein J0I41_02610 [Filimonas sp.]|nr:hypothetical protein [Filimonas sp.]